MNRSSSLRPGYLLSFSAALVWATTSTLIKHLLDYYGLPPMTIAFWRDAIIALVCLTTLLLLKPSLLRVNLRTLRNVALIGVLSIGVYHALWVTSIDMNGAAVAVVLIYTFPTFVTLGAWLFFKERISFPQIAALILALIGCALVVRIYDPLGLQLSWLGALIGLSTGITHAGYVLFSQRSVETHSPWTSLTYTMLFGSLVLMLLSLMQGPEQLLAVGNRIEPWLILLVLAIGPTLGGYALFTMALRFIPGRIASLIVVIEAPASVLLAVLLLGEVLEWPQIVGIALILGAIVLPHTWAIVGAGLARTQSLRVKGVS